MVGFLASDDAKAAQQRSEQEFQAWLNDPMGYNKSGYNKQYVAPSDRGVVINLNQKNDKHNRSTRFGSTIKLGSNRRR